MSKLDDHTRTAQSELVFEPPAPGRWELETAHHGLRPLSPFLRHTYQRAFEGHTLGLAANGGKLFTVSGSTNPQLLRIDANSLTLEECIELLAAAPVRGRRGKKKAKKKAAKKTAAKKTSKKKATKKKAKKKTAKKKKTSKKTAKKKTG